MSDTKQEVEVQVSLTVTLKRVSDLLVGAFEGGSNYWYRIDQQRGQPAHSFVWEGDRYQEKNKPHVADYALNPGCSLTIVAIGDDGTRDKVNGAKQWTLDLDTIKAGLHTMATKYPRHFGNFWCEEDDAETADVFLQCCLFGEIVYG